MFVLQVGQVGQFNEGILMNQVDSSQHQIMESENEKGHNEYYREFVSTETETAH
jgi:hypothetical protein